MSNHLKTAYDLGAQKAIENAGYKSAEEVNREAIALGLIEAPKTAAAAPSPLETLFRK